MQTLYAVYDYIAGLLASPRKIAIALYSTLNYDRKFHQKMNPEK